MMIIIIGSQKSTFLYYFVFKQKNTLCRCDEQIRNVEYIQRLLFCNINTRFIVYSWRIFINMIYSPLVYNYRFIEKRFMNLMHCIQMSFQLENKKSVQSKMIKHVRSSIWFRFTLNVNLCWNQDLCNLIYAFVFLQVQM